MAEEKSSFILFTDIIEMVESLQEDEAGRLFKHILRYVNDKDPVAPDRITEISFAPIKQSLKRTLKKWKKSKEAKSVSGVMGNLKRWHKDLYDKVKEEMLTIDEAISIANDRKASQSIANVAVSDSVSVSVPVSVSEKDNSNPLYFPLEKLEKILLCETSWQESVGKETGLKLIQVSYWIPRFVLKIKNEGEEGKTVRDAKSHFSRWLKIELKKPENKSQNKQSTNTTQSKPLTL